MSYDSRDLDLDLDANITTLIDRRRLRPQDEPDIHSSLMQRLSPEVRFGSDSDRLKDEKMGALDWNLEGTFLASGGSKSRLHLFSYSSWGVQTIDTKLNEDIDCIKFIPENRKIAFSSGDKVLLYDLQQGGSEQICNCWGNKIKAFAVKRGDPNTLWCGRENGVHQFDLRQPTSSRGCSIRDGCRSVLVDCRRAWKESLTHRPGLGEGFYSLSTIDINPVNADWLLVGGSDQFGRLFDRRMLTELSVYSRQPTPPSCVKYYAPMHFSVKRDPQHYPFSWTNSLSYASFSPYGDEVLLTYERNMYLMDAQPEVYSDDGLSGPKYKERIDLCNQLMKSAEDLISVDSLSSSDKRAGIEACNEVIDRHGPLIKRSMVIRCLCQRAMLHRKRPGYYNGEHMAVRDAHRALKLDPFSNNTRNGVSKILKMEGFNSANKTFGAFKKLLTKIEGMEKNAGGSTSGSGHQEENVPPLRWLYSTKSSPVTLFDAEEREKLIDMRQTYYGLDYFKCKPSFIGPSGEYVAAGSSEGWFIWEKKTARVINELRGGVKYMQGHPHESVIATCGIDGDLKIWTPRSSVKDSGQGGLQR